MADSAVDEAAAEVAVDLEVCTGIFWFNKELSLFLTCLFGAHQLISIQCKSFTSILGGRGGGGGGKFLFALIKSLKFHELRTTAFRLCFVNCR